MSELTKNRREMADISKTVPFLKLSGAGNTFVMVEEKDVPNDMDRTRLALQVCAPDGPAEGADGMIVVGPGGASDRFGMDYYNSDGSTGMMCGNGGRCAVRFAYDRGYVESPDDLRFTNAGIEYSGRLVDSEIEIGFPDPLEIRPVIWTDLEGLPTELHFVDVGTPHLLVILNRTTPEIATHLDDLDIDRWGPALRHHAAAGPTGANANFLELLPDESGFRLRTFERGVEGETGACGTGAIASALIGSILHDMPSPVRIIPTSRDELQIGFSRSEEGDFSNLTLRGPAVVLMEGRIEVGSGNGGSTSGSVAAR